MKNDDLPTGCIALIGIAILALFLGGVSWKWYVSGEQAAVYRRQGTEMSQWEVFIGNKPIERAITIK